MNLLITWSHKQNIFELKNNISNNSNYIQVNYIVRSMTNLCTYLSHDITVEYARKPEDRAIIGMDMTASIRTSSTSSRRPKFKTWSWSSELGAILDNTWIERHFDLQDWWVSMTSREWVHGSSSTENMRSMFALSLQKRTTFPENGAEF